MLNNDANLQMGKMGKINQAFDQSYLPILASSMFEVRNTDILLKFQIIKPSMWLYFIYYKREKICILCLKVKKNLIQVQLPEL